MSQLTRRRVTVPARILAAAMLVWSAGMTTALAEDDPPPFQWPQVDPPTQDTGGDPPVQQWPQPPKP